MGSYPTASTNATVTSPTPSAVPTPYMGSAIRKDVDQKVFLCFFVGLVSAVMLV